MLAPMKTRWMLKLSTNNVILMLLGQYLLILAPVDCLLTGMMADLMAITIGVRQYIVCYQI